MMQPARARCDIPQFGADFAEVMPTNRDALGNGHDMRYRKLAGAILEMAIRDTLAGDYGARRWLLSSGCNAMLDGLVIDDAMTGAAIVAALDAGRLIFDKCLWFDGVATGKM